VLKRVVRRLLAPALGRQVQFNASTMRIVAQLAEQLDVLASRHGDQLEYVMLQHAKATQALRDELRNELSDVRREILAVTAESRAGVDAVRHEVADVRTQAAGAITESGANARVAQGLRERIARVERVTRRLTHAADGAASVTPPASRMEGPAGADAFDYGGFEERFRGAEEVVQARQRAYLPLFAGRDRVVDLGCGRGEFLALLHASNVGAVGVDGDLDMVLASRDKGLEVHHDDLFAFLERQPDGSLGGIFAAQVIEHLPPAKIIALVGLVLRKLAPGAPVVLETPNPGCLTIFANSFYMDFTHVRPVHPDAMRFLLEAAGYEDVDVRYSSPVDEAVRFPDLPDTVAGAEFAARFNRAVDHANALLYGCQDYAVIGRRGIARPAVAVA
jgi:O-antigen chain-terminating methyltransferase